jgi:hypothetical protein
MSEMSLDQVRDWHRSIAESNKLLRAIADPHEAAANAIDAEIQNRYGCMAAVIDILDGKDTGVGACNEPWQSVRMRLIGMVKRQASAQGEAVGEAGSMPGTDGFTMAVFRAADVPIGTKVYTAPPAAAVPDIDSMARRFLSWRLPDDFCPDAGISFEKPRNPHWWPVGTNLFTAEQAEQMVRHMLAAAPQPDAKDINYES